ncbi:MAG: MBL fold metallo-hydrolase, partial [Anaerolineaceae bacterium]|nr:MBL fold metallo-hydrolase [Anaerolineaceae bacterium]
MPLFKVNTNNYEIGYAITKRNELIPMKEERFSISIRGTRGGYPKPGISTVRYGGNTTCFEIRAGEHLIIVDAGTGIIDLGKEILADYNTTGNPMRMLLLFTHHHHDHTQGFPFFEPILHPMARIDIFGINPDKNTSLREELIRLLQPPVSPLSMDVPHSQIHFRQIRGGDTIVAPNNLREPEVIGCHEEPGNMGADYVYIQTLRGKHHPYSGILFLRINYNNHSIVIATDTEGFIGGDRDLINFAMGADLLLHDAEYDETE